MAAAITRDKSRRPNDGLQPSRLTRDLYEIAELIEIGFAGRLDAQGRAAIREMKMLSRLGPLLWIIALLDNMGMGIEMGFVWREDGRVVGNTSLYRGGVHPDLGKGWMIANVTVHPDYRRRGIALAMMEATIEKAQRLGGKWVALQVETNNLGAVSLYEGMGFQRFERLEQWSMPSLGAVSGPPPGPHMVRLRRSSEIKQERDLIFKRARVGAMAWTMPIDRGALTEPPFQGLGGLPEGRQKEHWALLDPNDPQRFQAMMWMEAKSWSKAKANLFFDPAYTDQDAHLALMRYVLSRPAMRNRNIRLETNAGLPHIEGFLRGHGFRRLRTLHQMRLPLSL